jgi:alpha-tubulin suppressor-like RCC1 family protein
VLGANKTFCLISAGQNHSLGIDKNGRVWAWGYSLYGQIGNNSFVNKSTPVSILGSNKTFCLISAGQNHSLGIDKNGKLWGWGYNNQGQIGDNSTTNKSTPVSVLGANKTFCQIISGKNHSLGIDKNGLIWGWGENTNGQLGTKDYYETPVKILSI